MKNYVLLLFLLLSPSIFAQEKVKFGEISQEDVQMSVYDKDPEASAVVLYESMDTRYDFNSQGLFVINNYFVRIKILTNDGLDYANQSISRYVASSRINSETYTGLSGNTFNWENGKIEKMKLSKEHIFEEKVSDTRVRTKFTFQGVKPGSVIEYKYQMTSPHYTTLNDYYFQRSIPVKYSRFELLIPEYFQFNKECKGLEPITTFSDKKNETSRVGSGGFSFISEHLLFETHDLPGLKDENYVWNISDYLTRVTFELKGIEVPGSLFKNYSRTWADVDEQLMGYDDFGKQFNHKLFKDEFPTWFTPEMTSTEKVRTIFNQVRSKISWNDVNTFWAKNPKSALKKGLGTSAEINAILISALREAGFDAYPIAMSLRYKGRIPITHPSIDSFNYFIVAVDVEGHPIYLDASSKYGDLNVLSPASMSDFARSIRNNSRSNWVDLSRIYKSKEVINLELSFNEEGILAGSLKQVKSGEFRYAFRSDFDKYKDQNEYVEKRQIEDDIQISNLELTGMENKSEKSQIQLEFARKEVSKGEDLIYFNPILVPIFKDNPFKAEDRKLPVEFSYPYQIQINSIIRIPEGYVVEELPKQQKIALNENDASFTYLVVQNEVNNTVSIRAILDFDKIIYLQSEYAHLRDFFTYLTTTNNAPIVLKKKI